MMLFRKEGLAMCVIYLVAWHIRPYVLRVVEMDSEVIMADYRPLIGKCYCK